ncbi:DEAD/DEAH box helicase [Flexithrix dorotheae]|uniref:DEAD/DEAH box helicase n=1 Tax=Flexithrix dorotheae TaxID=70993 RepID=UPI00037BD408|nr:DEAD/DEAH box helicase [Flexithrix dorotheae]
MKSFSSTNIHQGILKALEEKGISNPTAIQSKTIPVLLAHKGDFVGRSATGTGKTFAFGIPLLSRMDTASGKIQAVVLVPTRELCEQVGNELIALGKYIPGLKIEGIYGGMSLKTQIQELSNGVHIVVATPGRLMDLIQRKVVYLSTVKFIVFDEADEMLLKGFQTDIDKILSSANRSYSSWLFSATMPDEINGIVNKYLKKELVKVGIGKSKETNAGIDHWVIELAAEEKLNVLLHFLTRFGNQKGIIFCRTKSGVQKLYKQLSANKFTCGAIHGDLPQGLRNKVMEQYKNDQIPLLLATDVASRGMDVQDIGFVIQYHLPDTVDAYTHRSGRTSRAGKTGISLTFVFPEERENWEKIKSNLKLMVKKVPVPSPKDQLINKAILWARKIAKNKPVASDRLDDLSREDFKNELRHLSKDELLEKILATFLREHQG